MYLSMQSCWYSLGFNTSTFRLFYHTQEQIILWYDKHFLVKKVSIQSTKVCSLVKNNVAFQTGCWEIQFTIDVSKWSNELMLDFVLFSRSLWIRLIDPQYILPMSDVNVNNKLALARIQ